MINGIWDDENADNFSLGKHIYFKSEDAGAPENAGTQRENIQYPLNRQGNDVRDAQGYDGDEHSSSDEEPSYNAFDYLPKIKFPKTETGGGTYGSPVEYNGNPIESSQPYKVIRSEEKDGTFYHFVDQLPTRRLTPSETDAAAGVIGLPVGAYTGFTGGLATGAKVGGSIHPLVGEVGALAGGIIGALHGGADGYAHATTYLNANYHRPIQRQGNHFSLKTILPRIRNKRAAHAALGYHPIEPNVGYPVLYDLAPVTRPVEMHYFVNHKQTPVAT